MLLLLLSVLVHSAFGQQLPQLQHERKNPMKNANAVDEEMLSNAKVAQSPAASHQLLFNRLSDAKDRFVHSQLAKMMAMEEEEGNGQRRSGAGGGGIERRIPRPQRRWLMRTQELKDGSGGDQYVKRVVSESELNSLLKNAWLGKKK
uniref:Uncharacterized protein n=1 Tax=Globodera rostochiensis TaxID=31243 RepID=A0A914IAN5_GLORO